METKQDDIYSTAVKMNIQTPYVCGWGGDFEYGHGWKVIRMRDNAILEFIGATQSGVYGQVKALEAVKARLFERGINKNEITFI